MPRLIGLIRDSNPAVQSRPATDTPTGPALPAFRILVATIRSIRTVREASTEMLQWTAVFLALAILAAMIGFGGFGIGVAWLADTLMLIFLSVAIATLFPALFRNPIEGYDHDQR